MADLMDKLGKKTSAEGSASAEPVLNTNTNKTEHESRGTNMLNKTQGTGSGSAEPAASASAAKPAEAQGANAPESSDKGDDWTTDSALKEIKKLREENKQYRVRYADQIEKLKQEQEASIAAARDEAKSLLEAKKELDKLKSEQEDKKRDLSEKLIHRESKISELQTILDVRQKQWEDQQRELTSKLTQYEVERQAETQVYKDRLEEELNKIPDKFRDYAQLIVRGAGDPRDAMVALTEAKIKGMFEERTVIVNHSVPGAADGARVTKERIDANDRAARDKMSPQQKIKSALESMKSGQSNTAFRTK